MYLLIVTFSVELIICLISFYSLSFILALPNQTEMYEDRQLGFKFSYPSGWKHILEKDLEGTGVHFSPLPTYPNDTFADLLIYTNYHQQNKTLQQYFHEFISEQLCCIDNKSLKLNSSKLGGIESINASWNLRKENNEVYGKAFLNFSIKDGVAYVIHYDANLKTFNQWLPEIKKLIQSFEIID